MTAGLERVGMTEVRRWQAPIFDEGLRRLNLGSAFPSQSDTRESGTRSARTIKQLWSTHFEESASFLAPVEQRSPLFIAAREKRASLYILSGIYDVRSSRSRSNVAFIWRDVPSRRQHRCRRSRAREGLPVSFVHDTSASKNNPVCNCAAVSPGISDSADDRAKVTDARNNIIYLRDWLSVDWITHLRLLHLRCCDCSESSHS